MIRRSVRDTSVKITVISMPFTMPMATRIRLQGAGSGFLFPVALILRFASSHRCSTPYPCRPGPGNAGRPTRAPAPGCFPADAAKCGMARSEGHPVLAVLMESGQPLWPSAARQASRQRSGEVGWPDGARLCRPSKTRSASTSSANARASLSPAPRKASSALALSGWRSSRTSNHSGSTRPASSRATAGGIRMAEPKIFRSRSSSPRWSRATIGLVFETIRN